jgi:hypothetical protein
MFFFECSPGEAQGLHLNIFHLRQKTGVKSPGFYSSIVHGDEGGSAQRGGGELRLG